jgi:tetratricopeptide (TPR) repeat protein
MQQAHLLKTLYHRYYPKNNGNSLNLLDKITDWENLNKEEKDKLAEKFLQEGELLLAKKDTSAIEFFNAASQLKPESAEVWLRQGKAFSAFGKLKNQEKALYLASKNFKMAASIDSSQLEIWWQWAKALAFLGNKTQDANYLQSAKENYEKAIALLKPSDKDVSFKIYWEYANLWMSIAEYSEEAGDVRLAIQAYRMSFAHQTKISADFWCDFGKAYLQMALFINDNRLYVESIDYFNKALRSSKDCLDGWISKAHAYTELYINTMDERCFRNGHEAYKECLSLSPHDSNLLLLWAQLLGESGKLTGDSQKLKMSVDKCVDAYNLNKKDPSIIGQWVESLSYLGALSNSLDLILEAEERIEAATSKHPKNSDLWYAYGICQNAFSIYYNDLEFADLAIEKFQIGLSIDRSSAELWHAMALAHTKIGKEAEDIDCLKRASKFYLRAIDLKPYCPSLSFDYATHLLSLGELEEDKKTLEEALFYLEQTLNNQKDAVMQHPNWLFTYGCILDLLGDSFDEENNFYKKALQAFHNVLLIDPDYPSLHYHIALCYSHLGELTFDPKYFKQAISSFNLALRQNEENDLVYLEWGLTLILLAEQEEQPQQKTHYFLDAEQKILRSGQLGNQHAYYHLACLYSLLKRLDESLSLLMKADEQEILPSIEELLEDEWLDNLKSTEGFKSFINMLESKQNRVDGY